ncbi:flagellar hook-associated protein FlgL [Thiohalorhabdus methylotrophus]|uniref:Flagellar hook-associated protein FlgL n=1 Tax=Thiohalorhabdus methylotrophus TaxID=3242694 RepID=A0ABV4TVY0_9GAMM
MVARVSDSMMLDVVQGDLRRNYNRVFDAQREAATGDRVRKPSDDPTAMQTLKRYEERLKAMDGYDRNVEELRGILNYTNTQYDEASKLLQRGRDLALYAANETNTPSDRKAIQEEAEEVLKQLSQIANEQLEGEYLFSGTASNRQSVVMSQEANGVYSFEYPGNIQPVEYGIGREQRITVDHSIKRPGSPLRQGLEALATMVEGFDEKQFSHLYATSTAADTTLPLGNSNSGLPVEELRDANGDGAADPGRLSIRILDKQGEVVAPAYDKGGWDAASGNNTADLTIDPSKDALDDPDKDPATPAESGNGDIVDRLDDIEHLSAWVNDEGRVEIKADEGYRFEVTRDDVNLRGVLGMDQDVPQLQTAIRDIDRAINSLASERGELGSKLNRLDLAADRRGTLRTELEKLSTHLGDVDVFKAASELMARQGNLQAAMKSSSVLRDTSILNHI